MGNLRESEVQQTIVHLREAEQQLAIIRSKKKEVLAELSKLGVKPEDLKSTIQELTKKIDESDQVIARRVRKAQHVLERINDSNHTRK